MPVRICREGTLCNLLAASLSRTSRSRKCVGIMGYGYLQKRLTKRFATLHPQITCMHCMHRRDFSVISSAVRFRR